MHILKSHDSDSIRKKCERGEMTPNRIAEMTQHSGGRAALDRYANERYREQKHFQRLHGKEWDGVDKKGNLFKNIVDPSDIK